jgi:protein SCO1/2
VARTLTVVQTETRRRSYLQGVKLPAALLGFLLAATLITGCGGGKTAQAEPIPQFKGAPVTTPKVVPDFTLHDARGEAVSLGQQRGKLVLLTFIYTHCPDVCPLITSNLNDALSQLGSERKDVRVLAVSVDPKGDTPKAVKAYEKLHHLLPEFRYLIGSSAELKSVWAKYNVTAVEEDPELVDHVAYTLLVDQSGKGRVLYDSHVKSAQVVHDVRLLLS